MIRRLGFGILLFFILVSISGCTLDRITAQQEKATGYWDELVGKTTFGQSFVSEYDNLYRIDLSTATFSRANSAPVIFTLRKSPQDSDILRSITLPGAEIQNEQPTTIVFEPISGSAALSYYFSLTSPEATPGNAITVYANQQDQYTSGSAYRNGAGVAGDLAFTAYSRQTFSLFGIVNGMVSTFGQDLPFFLCYGALLLTGICGLFLLRRKGQ